MSIISQTSSYAKSHDTSMSLSDEMHSTQQINFPLEIQTQLNNFFSLSLNNSISNSNISLNNFVSVQNISLFKEVLITSKDINAKFYSIEALLFLFTNYSNQISSTETLDIYSNLMALIFNIDSSLNNSLNSQINSNQQQKKIIYNLMIKLLCRIVRLNWSQISEMRNIYDTIFSYTNEDFSPSLIIPFDIFTELIYQFQSYDGIKNNPIQINKMQKVISEFKDSTLLQIFNYSMTILFSLFQHKFKTENMEEFMGYINKISKCLNECMDYEDDLNAKEDNYSKFEIKPVFIPNNRKRLKDKKLDIEVLSNLSQNLFDTYSSILKAMTTDNSISNEKILNKSSSSLKLLQKLLVMKVVYLDINKIQLLKIYQDGLGNILFNRKGFIHHSLICEMIYNFKKNYSYPDLLDNTLFFNYIYEFTNETLFEIKNNKKNDLMQGFIYLLRFFGYFSHNIKNYSIKKEKIEETLIKILTDFLDLNYSFFIMDIDDIVSSFGICGEGVFEKIIKLILLKIDESEKNNNFINLCFHIRFGCELLKNNYNILQEEKIVNSIEEKNISNFSFIKIESESKEEILISKFIGLIFSMIKKTVFPIKNPLFNTTLIHFINFFIKHFLNPYLKNNFLSIFNSVNESVKSSNSSNLLCYFIHIIVMLSQSNQDNNKKLIIKSLNLIKSNIIVEESYNINENQFRIYIGKIILKENELIESLQQLFILLLNNSDWLSFKLRKKFLQIFYYLYFKTSLPFTMKIGFINGEILKIKNKEKTYLINIIDSLVSSINEPNNYENMINVLMPSLEDLKNIFLSIDLKNIKDIIYILKLLKNITKNCGNRIQFSPSSMIPFKLFSIYIQIVQYYYKLAGQVKEIKDEEEKYQLQILPISYLIKIFSNFYKNKIIQFSTVLNSDYNLMKVVFNNLSDLIFSISIEDTFAYFNKFKNLFTALKIIYCDFIKEFPNICELSKFKLIVRMLILIYDLNDISEILIDINDIIYIIGKLKLENQPNIQFIFEDIEINNYLKQILSLLFNKIMLDDELIRNNINNLEQISKSIYILSKIYKDYYNNLFDDILKNSNLEDDEKEKTKNAFEDLNNIENHFSNFNELEKSVIDYDFLIFKRKIIEYYNKIKEIILYHVKK